LRLFGRKQKQSAMVWGEGKEKGFYSIEPADESMLQITTLIDSYGRPVWQTCAE